MSAFNTTDLNAITATCSSSGGYSWNTVTQVAFVLMIIIFVALVVLQLLACIPSLQPLPLHAHSLPAQHCFSCVLSPKGIHAHVGIQFLLLGAMIFALAYDSWAMTRIDSADTEMIAGLIRLRVDSTTLPVWDCMHSALDESQRLQCMAIKVGSGLTLACGLAACLTAVAILVFSALALHESDPFTPFIWRLSCTQAVASMGSTLFYSIPTLITLQSVVHCGFIPWISWYVSAASTALSLYLCLYYRRAVLDFPAKSPLRIVQNIKQAPHSEHGHQQLPKKSLKRTAASSTRLEDTNDLRRLNGLAPLYPGQTEEPEFDEWEMKQQQLLSAAAANAEEERLSAALGLPPLLQAVAASPFSSSPSLHGAAAAPVVLHSPYSLAMHSPAAAAPAVTLHSSSDPAAYFAPSPLISQGYPSPNLSNQFASGSPVGSPTPKQMHQYQASMASLQLHATQNQFNGGYQGALHSDDDASSYYQHHVAIAAAARMGDGNEAMPPSSPALGIDSLQLGHTMLQVHRPPALAPMSVTTPTGSTRRPTPVNSTRQATLLAQFRTTSSNSPRLF